MVTMHAIQQALEREISYPEQVYRTIMTGTMERFGKHYIRFIKRSPKGSTICIAEEQGELIIIRTVERGN